LSIGRQAIATLQAHDWPGNIRELRNVIERAVIMSRGDRLRLDLAMVDARPGIVDAEPAAVQDILSDAEIRQQEKANMLAALNRAQWRISGDGGAAELLALKPSTLAYRMRAFDIEKPR